ncbi:bactofilin family protein [Salinivirga cyanobacteriivorans]|uniref:Putative acyltransferase n=1 Tax=Salinivirga cyanobacteriivorans TaxID=1307839 RepID=A0A0S2HZZ2_9BACT|nr:polymer-forming cytoskeletal protein [Salinivirga cyanobacteriivorans]ALO15683.1 putative acyltransferase [Salinivirga cyanobacteriivorans]
MSKNTTNQPSNAVNTICEGTQITGDIVTNGEIRIDGKLQGNLQAKGKVVVGPTGSVNGEISCKNCDVQGQIEGKVEVGQLLSLKSSSKITGDIITHQLGIEPGARLNGNCKMDGQTNLREETRKK